MSVLIEVISITMIVVLILPSKNCSNGQKNDDKQILNTSLHSPDKLPLLPDINESWRSIRLNNKTYVDKTRVLKMMLSTGGQIWACLRPHGFGKSLFIQMVRHFFSGEEHLFRGLDIHEDGNTHNIYFRHFKNITTKWIQFPVIHLNFGTIQFETFDDFDKAIKRMLRNVAHDYHIDHSSTDDYYISDLISDLYSTFDRLPVIILIDEHDKPYEYAMHTMDNPELAQNVTNIILDHLNGVIHSSEVVFLFLSEISGSCLASMDCDLYDIYNIDEITFDPRFSDAFGFTRDEIVTYFMPHLEKLPTKKKSPVQELTSWYKGYSFDEHNEATPMFNPVDIITCLRKKKFDNITSA